MGVFRKNKSYLAGLRMDEVRSLAEVFVRHVLMPDLRPTVSGRVGNHLAKNDTVVLLTGAPDFIAGPIAELLHIPHLAAAVCETRNGCFSSLPPRIHPVGIAKVKIAGEMCRRFGATLDCCSAYADSASDIPLMASVSVPIAVHPDVKLRRYAKRQGWQIIAH